MLRDVLRNAVLTFFPPTWSYKINVWKNVTSSYLEPEMPILVNLLKNHPNRNSGLSAIDIGANLGLFCYIFSSAGARVVAIEPQPKLAAYLKKIVPSNIEVRQQAVSDNPGSAKLHIPRIKGMLGAFGQRDALASIEPGNTTIYENNTETDEVEVPTTTLDEIAGTFDAVDFVKIDVEGHELAVLRGGASLIARQTAIFFIEIVKKHNKSASVIGDLFYSHNYKAYCVVAGRPVLLASTDDFNDMLDNNVRDGAEVNNYFFVPHDKLYLFAGMGTAT